MSSGYDDAWEIELYQVDRELRTTIDKVRFILAKHPEARNNYMYLVILFWRYFEPWVAKYVRYIPLDVLRNMTPIETITRSARKIWSNGQYLPTDPNVLHKRNRREKAFRKVITKI